MDTRTKNKHIALNDVQYVICGEGATPSRQSMTRARFSLASPRASAREGLGRSHATARARRHRVATARASSDDARVVTIRHSDVSRRKAAQGTPRTTPRDFAPRDTGVDARGVVCDFGRGVERRAMENPTMSMAAAAAAAAAATVLARRLASSESTRKKTVVLGAGFAGCELARDLASSRDVRVLDVKEYFEYVPATPAALAGNAPLRRISNSNRFASKRERSLTVPYKKILPRSVGFTCVQSGEIKVCEDHVVADGERIDYDELVVATGSRYGNAALKARPGSERARTRSGRREQIAEARAMLEGGKTVVIVGGGAVGVELASELGARAKELNTGAKVLLLHNGQRLLDGMPKAVAQYAADVLVRQGVSVYLGQTYNRIGTTFVGRMNENVIKSDHYVMCVGSKPNTEYLKQTGVEDEEAINVPLDALGRVRIDEGTRQVIGYDNVYAVGDCACKLPDQSLASYAHWEAEYVAKRIACDGDERKLRQLGLYAVPPRIVAVSLGPRDGVVSWGDAVVARGIFAAMIKCLVQFWFVRFLPAPYAIMKRLPSLKNKPPASVILLAPPTISAAPAS